jgi:hypothetical protein
MSSTMRVALEMTADNRQAVTAIAGVRQEVEKLGPAAAASGQVGAAGITQLGTAAAGAATPLGRAAGGLRETEVAARAAGQAVGITSNQMRQLAPQLNDIATQLAMGQSPFMILAAQGGQITQIFGGVRNTLAALAGFLGPGGIAAILGVGIGGAIAVGLERDARALNDLSQRLRATRQDAASLARDVDNAAQAVSQTSGVSRGDARDAGRIIAGQRNFQGDQAEIQSLIRLSADLARVMGVDVTQAAEQFVAKAIRDPAAAAREASAGGLLGFNDSLRRQIELLAAAGDKGTATRLVLEQLGRASAGAAQELTPLQSMMQNLNNVLSQAADAVQRLAQGAAGIGQRMGRTVFDSAPNAPEIPQADWEFARRLSTRESGNRAGVMNAQGSTGLYQFGAARLARLGLYQPGEGENLDANQWIGRFQIPGFEGVRNIGDFRGNERAQDAAFARHLADIDRVIATIPGAEGFNRDGLRAVTHLGGEGGLRRFVAGTGDTADANGTRLSGYYREFGGGDRPAAPAASTPGSRAEELMRGRDTVSDRSRALTAREGVIQAGLEGLDPASEQAQRYREELRSIRAELAGLDSPLTQANRRLADQFTVMGQAAGGARNLAQAEVDARNEARKAGLDGADTDALIATRQAEAQHSLTTAFNDSIAARDREIAGQRHGLEVAQQGAAAVERETIAQQARTEALRTAAAGTEEYSRQVEALTARLTALASTPRISSLLVDQAQRRDNQNLQQSLIGASATERAQRTAELRARQRLGAGADTPEGQTAIASERALAANQVELERQQATFQEIGRVGEQAFDRIGSAITSGTLDLKNMGRIGQSVISELVQAFAKMAILNPIKNALGGNSQTLSDAVGLLGSLFGNSTLQTGSATSASTYASVGGGIDGAFGFHAGGIAGGVPTFFRAVNDNVFTDARRYHTGGLIGHDEVPAILQKGEGVFTAEQMAALGPAGHNVTVNMPVNFSGDSGSQADRESLLALVDQRVRAGVAAALPSTVKAAHAYTLAEVNRGGAAARTLGRR